jgi:hypothetical protein
MLLLLLIFIMQVDKSGTSNPDQIYGVTIHDSLHSSAQNVLNFDWVASKARDHERGALALHLSF